MSGCDSCPGVEAVHHLCDRCVQDDIKREKKALAQERAATEREKWSRSLMLARLEALTRGVEELYREHDRTCSHRLDCPACVAYAQALRASEAGR